MIEMGWIVGRALLGLHSENICFVQSSKMRHNEIWQHICTIRSSAAGVPPDTHTHTHTHTHARRRLSRGGHLRYFLIISIMRKDIFAFFIKLIWLGGRLLNRDWCRNRLQGIGLNEISTFYEKKTTKNTASAQLCVWGFRPDGRASVSLGKSGPVRALPHTFWVVVFLTAGCHHLFLSLILDHYVFLAPLTANAFEPFLQAKFWSKILRKIKNMKKSDVHYMSIFEPSQNFSLLNQPLNLINNGSCSLSLNPASG